MASSSPAFDAFVVLDFEATCAEGQRIAPQEIIELPSHVIFTGDSGPDDSAECEFHQYIRPVFHPQLTPFCTNLTGITQATVDGGNEFKSVFLEHSQWLRRIGLDPDAPDAPGARFIFVTCGDWDLKTCLPNQLAASRLGKASPAYLRWINIKTAYRAWTGVNIRGMTDLLERLGLPLVGRHHSGIDDTRNIAACLRAMIAAGWQPTARDIHTPDGGRRRAPGGRR
eukprot:m.306345 g.306345  ORF g.306345 m.306345 type:complete len:226 (-) comp18805_c0_seq1:259-936(-)